MEKDRRKKKANLLGIINTNSSVKAGPADPEEEGSSKREDITRVRDGLVGVVLGVLGREPAANSKAKVAAKHVDGVSTSDIEGLEGIETEAGVDPVEDGLEDAHDEKLEGRGLSEDGSVTDHDRSGAEQTLEQVGDVELDLVHLLVQCDELGDGLQDGRPLHSKSFFFFFVVSFVFLRMEREGKRETNKRWRGCSR